MCGAAAAAQRPAEVFVGGGGEEVGVCKRGIVFGFPL